jgi:hypothetical protein
LRHVVPTVSARELLQQARAVLYEKSFSNPVCGVAIHALGDVAVQIKRDPDVRVAEELAHDLGVNAASSARVV